MAAYLIRRENEPFILNGDAHQFFEVEELRIRPVALDFQRLQNAREYNTDVLHRPVCRRPQDCC